LHVTDFLIKENVLMEKLRREFESLGWNRTGSVVLALACQAASRVRTCSVLISSRHVVKRYYFLLAR
jgi:hypothetical protein